MEAGIGIGFENDGDELEKALKTQIIMLYNVSHWGVYRLADRHGIPVETIISWIEDPKNKYLIV